MPESSDAIRKLSEFLDDDRDDHKFQQFSEWLTKDEKHVRAFVEQLLVEEDLRQSSLIEDLGRYASAEETSGKSLEKEVRLRQTSSSQRGWGKPFVLLAIAGGILVSMTIGFALQSSRVDQVSLDTSNSTDESPAQPVIVATLGDAKDCRWESGTEALPTGHLFTAGSGIHLASGIAQLTFEAGAVLLLQGPCQIELAENAIELSHGRVSAVVPQSATGFMVTTPSSEIIDLGTKFGVNVDGSGNSQVHVFSGEVVTRARNEKGETVGEPMFVTTHNAIHFRPGTLEAQRYEADEAAFVRWLDDQDHPQVDALPFVEGRVLFWLSNGNWLLDENRCVNLWRDALCSGNDMPDNALQANANARPMIVENSIGGYPAVRFDGVDDCLITTPVTSANSQTVVFVASIHDSTCDYPQIINYNGPPQFRRLEAPRPAILQMIAKIDSQQVLLVPFAWLGDEDTKTNLGISVGRAVKKESFVGKPDVPSSGEPFVAVYVYDHEASHAELWINNSSVGSSTAPTPLGLTSRKVIGRHGGHPYYFCGDIAELLIYDEGLDVDRVNDLSNQLAKKYNIPLSQ